MPISFTKNTQKYLFIIVLGIILIFATLVIAGYMLNLSLKNNDNYGKIFDNIRIENKELIPDRNYIIYVFYDIIEGEGAIDTFIIQLNKLDNSQSVILANCAFSSCSILENIDLNSDIKFKVKTNFKGKINYTEVEISKNKISSYDTVELQKILNTN
jgi:hypothetical protein